MNAGVLSADSQVTLLLCTHVAMPKGAAAGGTRPFNQSEWNDLAQSLLAKGLRPGELLSIDGPELVKTLGLNAGNAERALALLGRGAQLAIEMERLDSLGIWALTRSDQEYPRPLKETLGNTAPPVLFGSGDRSLLSRGFLAVVGSRDIDEAAQHFATEVGTACGRENHMLVSGAARGVDRTSMIACLRAGGSVIGVLADSLERTVRDPEYRAAVGAGRLALISAVNPKAPFSVANAMARNRYIYCLSRYGLVVSSSLENGGTRAGALEVLKHRWVPLFVRHSAGTPPGNHDLVSRGALPFPETVPHQDLETWLATRATDWKVPRVTSRQGLTTTQPANETCTDDDLFPVVWPHISGRLGKSHSLKELAEALRVETTQLRLWIERALKDGLVSESAVNGTLGEHTAGDQLRLEL